MTSLGVALLIGLFVRLGFWQLDRLAQRRTANASLQVRLNLPELDLNAQADASSLTGMEYRSVVARGEYVFDQQVILRNQSQAGQVGAHILTPLRLDGRPDWVLVDRGWIALKDAGIDQLARFNQPGQVEVKGVIRLSQSPSGFNGLPDPTLAPGQNRLAAWNYVNLPRLIQQTGANLLPIYLQRAPETVNDRLPYGAQPRLDLSEGPHLGYAIQWFAFALILGVGYVFLLRRSRKLLDQDLKDNR